MSMTRSNEAPRRLSAARRASTLPTSTRSCSSTCLTMREETFGPVLTISRVASMDEAIDRANRTSYGLGAAVFGKKRAYDAARRVRSGMASVNGVLSFAGFPALPFGGVGDSGFGRIHGEDGLKEFTRPKAIARQRFSMGPDMMSFE